METTKTWKIFFFDSLHFILTQAIFWPMPKFRPMPPLLKFYGPTSSMPNFQPRPPRPIFYRPMPPLPPTAKFDPCHPRTHALRIPTPPMLFSRLCWYVLPSGLVRFSAAMQLFKYSLLIPVSVLDFDFGLFVMNLIVTAEFDHCQYLRQTKKKDLEWRFEKRDKSSCSCIKVQNQVEKQV